MSKYICEKGKKQYETCKREGMDYCADCPHGIKIEEIEGDIKIIKESYIMATEHKLDENNKRLRQSIGNVLNELNKKDKVIDKIATIIFKSFDYRYPNLQDYFTNNRPTSKEDIKQYFYKKVEEENEQ